MEYDLEIKKHKYTEIAKNILLDIYRNYSSHIIGQENVKEEILSALKLYQGRNKKEPLVIICQCFKTASLWIIYLVKLITLKVAP